MFLLSGPQELKVLSHLDELLNLVNMIGVMILQVSLNYVFEYSLIFSLNSSSSVQNLEWDQLNVVLTSHPFLSNRLPHYQLICHKILLIKKV